MNDELLDIQEYQRKSPFMRHNYIEVEYVEYDHAVLRLDIRPESKNSNGGLSGGIITAMADAAIDAVAQTDGCVYEIRNSSMSFLQDQPEEMIRAQAWVRHRNRAATMAEVEITGQGGTLLAAGSYTLFCVKEGIE